MVKPRCGARADGRGGASTVSPTALINLCVRASLSAASSEAAPQKRGVPARLEPCTGTPSVRTLFLRYCMTRKFTTLQRAQQCTYTIPLSTPHSF